MQENTRQWCPLQAAIIVCGMTGADACVAEMTEPLAVSTEAPRVNSPAQTDEPADEPMGEPTMVVTTNRRAQSLFDYPGAITRLESATLRLTGATHYSEILNRVPGAGIQRGSGQEGLPALRSPVLTGAGSCGAFLFLEEGIPIRPVGTCNVNDLFELNIEQAAALEILRGPGPALYGSSAVHGLINVLLPRPRHMAPLRTSLELGAHDYRRLRLAVARPGQRTAIGALAHVTHDGGFRAESGFDEQKFNAVLDHRGERSRILAWLTATNLSQDTAGFIEGFQAYRDPLLRRSNADPQAYRDARSARLGLSWRQSAAGQGGPAFRAMVRSSRMDFLQHFLLGKPLERNGQDSATVLLSLERGTAGTQVTMGLDGEYSRSFLLQVQDGPTLDGSAAANAVRPAGRHYDFQVNAQVLGTYVQASLALTPALRASAGLRAEHVRYRYDNRMLAGNTDENGLPCPSGGCLYNRPADRADDFTGLTPKLGLLWTYAPRQQLYVNLADGYRAPETAELYRLQRQQSLADLDAERSRSAEIGARGQLRAVRYGLAAFHMNKRNVIFRDADGFNVSDGRTRHVGLEYELDWTLSPELGFSAAGTVARHTYRFGRQLGGTEEIHSGDDVDTAPRNLHTLRMQWNAGQSMGAELEWVYVGRYFTDAANEHRYPGHNLFNLRATWKPAARWRLTARVHNILDRRYADRADFAFGSHRYFPGQGRGIAMEIAYE